LNGDLIAELTRAFEAAGEDERLRAVVLRGAGKDFCSGADLAELQKIAEYSYEENVEDAKKLVRLFTAIRELNLPVIAAVHGRALAGGCGLATACDLVIATKSARFGYPEVKIGFVPAIVMAILRRNLGEKHAFELATQGFEITADVARKYGLVNRVCDDEGFEVTVREYASVYSKLSVSAVRLSKSLLYKMDGMTFADALAAGAEVNAEARMSEDCQKGIARFLDR
jgi:methylglutaconyl-CoA hydratase